MPAFNDLTGQTFERWKVLEWAGKISFGRHTWLCRCQCGTEKIVIGNTLMAGTSRSCGCLALELVRTHGMESTPTYNSWARMKQRCLNPEYKQYSYHGGRGISICDRWLSFENFFADMGEKPNGTSLDRIDNDGNYEPENCRWATPKEQVRNRRNTVWVEFNGEKMPLGELANRVGIPDNILRHRINRGCSAEQAVLLVGRKRERQKERRT